MKNKTLIFLALIVPALMLWGQSHSQIKKEFCHVGAINGDDINSHEHKLRFSISSVDPASGNQQMVYSEIHDIETNLSGVYMIIVGRGTAQTGQMDSIMFGKGKYIYTVEYDMNRTGEFSISQQAEIFAVPISVHATTSDSCFNDFDTDPLNEIQDISIQGNKLTLSGASTIVLPDEVEDADADAANELQNFFIRNDSVCLTGGNCIPVSIFSATSGDGLNMTNELSYAPDPIAPPVAILMNEAGDIDNGTIAYRYTYVTKTGETGPSAQSAEILVQDNSISGKININVIASDDEGVTGINLYRNFNGGPWSLAKQINENVSAEIIDSLPRNALGGEAMAPTSFALEESYGGSFKSGDSFQYGISYVTVSGETKVAFKSITMTYTNRSVDIYLPVSPEETVIGRNIYRREKTFPYEFKLLESINDNTSLIFNDKYADSYLQDATMPSASTAIDKALPGINSTTVDLGFNMSKLTGNRTLTFPDEDGEVLTSKTIFTQKFMVSGRTSTNFTSETKYFEHGLGCVPSLMFIAVTGYVNGDNSLSEIETGNQVLIGNYNSQSVYITLDAVDESRITYTLTGSTYTSYQAIIYLFK